MFSCGGEEKPVEKKTEKVEKKVEEVVEKVEEVVEEVKEPIAELTNVGVGPIKELILPESIDEALAEKGKTLYTDKACTSCHHTTEVITGPAPVGIFERRNPAWVMNMIMNPEKMIAEDPDAMALLEEYNNVVMTNQDVSEEEARAIVEFFRTIEE